MNRGTLLVVLFLVCCMAPSAPAQETAAIEKAVKECVDAVHHFPADEMEKRFFQKFDAFYNSATGRVQNNGYLNGDVPPQYQFNKCMASKGFPLK
jgi:hypothetical protein